MRAARFLALSVVLLSPPGWILTVGALAGLFGVVVAVLSWLGLVDLGLPQ